MRKNAANCLTLLCLLATSVTVQAPPANSQAIMQTGQDMTLQSVPTPKPAAGLRALAQKQAHEGEMLGKYVLIADPLKSKER